MPYILDIIIISIFILCFVWGSKIGFVRSLFKILSFFIAAALAFMLFNPFYLYVRGSQFGEKITQNVTNVVYNTLGEGEKENFMPDHAKEALEEIKIPKFMWDNVIENMNSAAADIKENTAQALSDSLSDLVLKVFSGIVLFLIIKIILSIGVFLLDKLMKLPVLNAINSLLGGIAGVLNGLMISYIVCISIGFLTSANYLTFIIPYIEKSVIFKYIYNNNFLGQIFFK